MVSKGYRDLVMQTKQQRIERIKRMQAMDLKPAQIAKIEGCSRQAIWKVMNEVDHGEKRA